MKQCKCDVYRDCADIIVPLLIHIKEYLEWKEIYPVNLKQWGIEKWIACGIPSKEYVKNESILEECTHICNYNDTKQLHSAHTFVIPLHITNILYMDVICNIMKSIEKLQQDSDIPQTTPLLTIVSDDGSIFFYKLDRFMYTDTKSCTNVSSKRRRYERYLESK